MVAAGKLRHRLTLSTVTRGRDSLGGITETATAGVTIWGSFEPISDSERFSEGRFAIRPTHRAVIRYRAGVSHRDRLNFQGRVFDIAEVRDPSSRMDGQLLELLCIARTDGPLT